MISTELTRRLGLRHPVVLAPMGGESGGELSGAVSAAGGLGLIGAGPTATRGWCSGPGRSEPCQALHQPDHGTVVLFRGPFR